jgi:lysophospholipase L1-like esterase
MGGAASGGANGGGVNSGGVQGGTTSGGKGSGGAQGGVGGGGKASGGSTASGGASNGGGGATGGFPPLTANVTLHVAGDSTAAIFPASDPTGRVGWAAVLQQFFTTGVTVNDGAQSGRSSKSFIDEGFWATMKAKIHSGDYVFIQFAHNDEKSEDPARYTDPATTFRTYLKTYISDTRAAGGFAVLLTPISRRQFSGTQIKPSHGAYPAAVIAVGQETGTPVIDMTEKTRIFLEAVGPTNSIPLFATDDNTHLSAKGAPEIAKLAVQGIRELGLPIAQRLAP